MAGHQVGHGNTVAAWTGVIIAFIGFLVLIPAVIMPNAIIGVIGSVIILASPVVGKVLQVMGYGQKA